MEAERKLNEIGIRSRVCIWQPPVLAQKEMQPIYLSACLFVFLSVSQLP